MTKHAWILTFAFLAIVIAGCPFEKKAKTPIEVKPPTIRSFSETLSITALASSGGWLWAGTPRGLLKWDLEGKSFVALGQKEGLPGERILALAPDNEGGLWALTAGGLAHELRAKWQSYPAVSVGDSVSGLVAMPGGVVWAGGTDGLARLKDGKWERFLSGTPITALLDSNQDLWVGTKGRGILRITGERVEIFGAEQGCDIDVVRGLAMGTTGPVAIGDSPGGPRLAAWAGQHFWTYNVAMTGPAGFDWIRRVGNDILVGAGSTVFSLTRKAAGDASSGPLKIKSIANTIAQAATFSLRDGLPSNKGTSAPPAPATPAAITTSPAPAAGKANPPVATATPTAKPAAPQKLNTSASEAPGWESAPWGQGKLPDSITTTASDGAALFLGTRFLGTARINPDGGVFYYRTGDLAQSAVYLSVACENERDCYVATGTSRAYSFDGQTFDPTQVDPEPGSRVLAIVNQPSGGVLAIHRGAKDPGLRISTVSGTHWAPIALQDVQVPEGVAGVTFASFAPNRRLWLGLHYFDRVGDRVDYGAAEVWPDEGKVVYHRQFTGEAKGPTVGMRLPNDIGTAFFRSSSEYWFGGRSGAVRVQDGEVRLFTENDGLESEYVHDIIEGPDGLVWVATSKGIGKFDGTRWTFPNVGDPLRVRATSLARDRAGQIFIGTNKGLLVISPRGTERIGAAHGLLDESVVNLAIDRNDRVWVLTEKGLSTISP